MKKLLELVVVVMFSACSTIKTIEFDHLVASEMSFPEMVRRVGVVNNMPLIEASEADLGRMVEGIEGDGKVFTEALAQGIAETNYFDEVVVYDTTLCNMKVSYKSHQSIKKEWAGNVLSAAEASRWIDELGVDLLLSVERIRIEVKEGNMIPGAFVSYPVVDGIITPVVRAYIAGHEHPILSMVKTDTIFWEPEPSLTFKKIVRESSEYAASMLLPYMLPYWKEIRRNYYDGGNVEMRDAAVFLREYNWEEAYPLWKTTYDKKKGNLKMMAAFNLALYHEMQGEFELTREYLGVAESLASENSVDLVVIRTYKLQLDELQRKYQQLQIQMNRFGDK